MHDPERDIRDIPLSQLELSPGNVRKTPADAAAFTELKASIAAHGLLENLITRSLGPGPDGPGRYAVIAGGRRLAAMQALAAEGALDEDHPVPCRMIGGIVAAEEVSLAENSGPRRHAPGRSGRGVPPLGRCGQHGGRHRSALRGLGAHRGETAEARQRRTGAARGLPRRRNRSGHIDGLRRHHGSCAPDRGLGGGEPAGLPARRLADQAPADRGPGSRPHPPSRVSSASRLTRRRAAGSTATCSPRRTSGGSGSTIPIC